MRTGQFTLLATALALGGSACEEKTPPDAPAAVKDERAPPAEATEEQAPDAPPPSGEGHELRYGDRVKAPELPAAENPPAKLTTNWKLEPGKRIDYDYAQLMAGRVGTKGGEQQVEGTGTLSVEATGTDTADAVLRDVEMKLSRRVGGKEDTRTHKPDEQRQKEVINLKEGAPPPQDPMVATMLRVPQKPIAVGETVTEPTRMQLESRGAPLWGKGATKTTLTRFVKCGEHTCAQLDIDLSISEVEVPDGVEGEFRARVHQKGVMLFDVDDGSLYSWQGATHISLQAEAPAPPSQPASPVPGMKEMKKLDMAQDHFHEVKRKPSA